MTSGSNQSPLDLLPPSIPKGTFEGDGAELRGAMTLVKEVVHPRGLGFPAQRKVYMLRKVDKLSWPKISARVLNLQGARPHWKVCRAAFHKMHVNTGIAAYAYNNCGRRPTLTRPLRRWLLW